MLTNVNAFWQVLILFGGSLGYALGEVRGAALGLAIVAFLGAVHSFLFGK